MIAHIAGLPVEETVVQLVPAGAAVVSAVAMVAWTRFDRMKRWLRGEPSDQR